MKKTNLKESIRFKELKELSLDEFELKCSDVKNTLELRNEIINGCVYIIRQVLSKERSDIILNKIINSNLKQTNEPKILDGVENLYYESNHIQSKKTEYSAVDKSWYFFPWNKDEIGIFDFIQPIFNNVILLNNKKTVDILKSTPIDGCVQRFHLINYPPNSGQISLHRDPVNICQVNSGIYLTEYGVDYKEGGFYVLNEGDEEVSLDEQMHVGDMILFYPGLAHGVHPIKPMDSLLKSDGRYFLNISLIESHHVEDRFCAVGIDL